MKAIKSMVCLLSLVGMGAASGADDSVAPTPNDRQNYVGDRFKLDVAYAVRLANFAGAADSNASRTRCAPAGTRLRSFGNFKSEATTYVGLEVAELPSEESKTVDGCANSPHPRVKVGDMVGIEQEEFDAVPKKRTGLSYGVLLVPFKYQWKGDKSFGSRASLGGYLGWREDWTTVFGVSMEAIAFAGAATVPVTRTENGNPKTDELSGLTYGVGLLGRLKNDFQLGIVVGADRVSKSAAYVNNGKPWIALSLGFPFSN